MEIMKGTCIEHPINQPLLLIRKWQLDFCEGNACAAALLSFFEYWHCIKLEMSVKNAKANRIAKEHDDIGYNDESLLQFHNQQDLNNGILGIYGKNSICEAIKYLEDKEVITTHRNPNPRYTFDKTKYYLFHPDVCNSWLDEQSDTDNELEPPKKLKVNDRCLKSNDDCLKEDDRFSENKRPLFKTGEPSFENKQSITEITTETTNRDYIQNKQTNKQACAENFIDFKNIDSVDPEVSQVVHYLNQEIVMPIGKLRRVDDLAAIKAMLDSGMDLSLIQKAALKAARTKPQGGFGIYYVKKIAEEIFVKEEASRKCIAVKQVVDASLKPTMKKPTVKKKIISEQEILNLKKQLKEKNIEFNNVCREITNAAGESKTSLLMRHSRLGIELSTIENSLKAISYD